MHNLGEITEDGQVRPAADTSDQRLAGGRDHAAVLVSCEAEAFHYMRNLIHLLVESTPGTWIQAAGGWNNAKH